MAHPLGLLLGLRSPSCSVNHLDTPKPGDLKTSSNRTKMGLDIKGLSNWYKLMRIRRIGASIMHIFREKEKKKGWRQSMVSLEVTVEHGWTIYDIPEISEPASTLKTHRTSIQYLKPSFSMILRAPTLEVNDDRARRRVHDRIPYPPVIKHG